MPDDSHENDVGSTEGAENPLARAGAENDRNVMEMVRAALRRRDMVLAFQPVVQNMENGKIAFYEGLIRILDRGGRIIPAAEFIETVEPTELGRRIDCLALEMGLAALADCPDLRLAINMSARSIGHPPWIRTLNRAIETDPTLAERLILEITESSAMVTPGLVIAFMRELQAKGIAFALDDFGTGYTAIRYLREFYFDILKIDGQFIRGIADDPDNQVLTSALIAIARHFDMFTVAENVETARDAAWLAAAGIDCMQGYAFGAPTLIPPWRAQTQRRTA
ncbi:EAL domain-containing protein [Rhodovulum sulfidophilum]|uniref:EAL domain-containing protein n=1 Tax=Rhodovulum sulfidophilum TaxID=35806 RepID=A0ABS1RNI1_RHOSU|nr:EAL domain-containing protein [Rhodovulum sulfidophilum]MBL3607619.1 EAL domain-containing protein [Rhodovulum sulfidophilum]MCE8457344.1 EAL domain-containing protein [Rhodovulum sulfidophilum]